MPSANPVGKVLMNEREMYTEPVKQAVIAVEHKIRNLEKRKGKLDQYRSEQDQGKELNADQLAAVAKYSEVIQQLDFAREMIKQLNQLSDETKRLIKKEQKKEIAEKALAEVERCRQLFLFQSILEEFRNEQVVQDFLNGAPGTVQVTMEDLTDLNVLSLMLPPRRSDPNFKSHVAEAAEHAAMLLDGKAKDMAGRKSYKQLKELLLSVSECEYFLNRPTVEVTPEEPSESVPSPSTLNNPSINESVPVQVVPIQESTYSFLQESQIDIESPHMDPAVVAVSSFVPPPISQSLDMHRMGNTNVVVPDNVKNHGGRGGDCSLTIDDEINEWDSKTGTTFINSENKETLDNGDHSNRFGSGFKDRWGRGNGNNRARGRQNGFYQGHSRGGGVSREFPNGRMGFYRSEYPENENDKEFRNRNGSGRGFRRGNGQSNNNPRGGGGVFRGPRGPNQRPSRTANGVVTTECY